MSSVCHVARRQISTRRLAALCVGVALLTGLYFGVLYGELHRPWNWIHAAATGLAFFAVMRLVLWRQRQRDSA